MVWRTPIELLPNYQLPNSVLVIIISRDVIIFVSFPVYWLEARYFMLMGDNDNSLNSFDKVSVVGLHIANILD